MLNKEIFFKYIRNAPFGRRISQNQVAGVERILSYWDRHYPNGDKRWLAYVLATVFRETGARMEPVRETFADSDAKAIRNLDSAWKRGKLKNVSKPYWRDNFFGRGLVQVTHEDNYKKWGLQNNPSKALEWDTSLRILFEGMEKGKFSPGNRLGVYFNDTKEDPVGARSIVNGVDKAQLIASYYRNFLDAIEKGSEELTEEEKIKEEEAEVTEPVKEESMIKDPQTMAVTAGGVVSGLISAITSPWGVAALGIIVVAIGVYFYFRTREKRTIGV